MLNEEKVRYMTELAIFEKREGKKIFPINRYFKSDYVGRQMFRAFFGYSICYVLLFGLWALYELDELLGSTDLQLLARLGLRALVLYGAGLLLYLAITRAVYAARYVYASRSQTMYASRLKHLMNRYGRERTERPRSDRGGRSV